MTLNFYYCCFYSYYLPRGHSDPHLLILGSSGIGWRGCQVKWNKFVLGQGCPSLALFQNCLGVYFVLSLIYPIFKGFLEKYFIHIRTFSKGTHWKVYLLPTQIFNFSNPSGTVVTRAWYLYEIWWIHAHLIQLVCSWALFYISFFFSVVWLGEEHFLWIPSDYGYNLFYRMDVTKGTELILSWWMFRLFLDC